MDVNIVEIKDGDQTRPSLERAPSVVDASNPKLEGSSSKKKRRRGKSKRKIMKPFIKAPWLDRRKNDKTKRNNRFRKIVLNKTHAPFNNNQFLMEIHKPEPDNNFNRTPARTRDSSFSIDSEDNYFYSLPEDEEEYLTKEFSSVYEDAQCERLSNMSKNELIQEYLLLEAKYENLLKRTDRAKPKSIEEDKGSFIDKDTSTNKDSVKTDKDSSLISNDSNTADEDEAIMRHVKEQEDQIRELQMANEQLRIENEALRQRSQGSSSEDSESDSSTSSGTSSSSSSNCSMSPKPVETEMEGELSIETHNGQNGIVDESEPTYPIVNGFHTPNE